MEQDIAEKPNAKAAAREATRARLLETGFTLIREKGLAATRVDDICTAAGVTKGGFFHHFASKDAWAAEVARHWGRVTSGLFEGAPYHEPADPLDRVLGYIAFRRAILDGSTADFTCVAGTLAQETHLSDRAVCEAAEETIFGHADSLVPDISLAKQQYASDADWTAESLAHFTQATLQGAFILAKARGGPEIAREMVDHLDRYVRLLFGAAHPPP
ncbi:MAG: TetR/AcrR family transcriptional regulator [Notoacmeibacter sp.]|nr:TetR/AcrR family transcriptional regulator [Notoacmeibacter sp.]MCC0032443.1 TetR/AcrR family transcriptional regulator [Brucellaceae bacterium]